MTTPNLALEEWEQDQSQPYVTVDTTFRVLDCLTQLAIIDRDLAAPPGSPVDGACYIPAAPATGDWLGHEDDVAMYLETFWEFRTPKTGWEGYVIDEDVRVRFIGGSPGGWEIV